MRWPWVSREAFEVTLQWLDRAHTRELELLAQVRGLEAEMLRMKREGFEPTPPPPEPIPDPLTPEIRQAIAQRSEPRSRERQQLESVAMGLLEAGIGAEDVAQQILEGEEAE